MNAKRQEKARCSLRLQRAPFACALGGLWRALIGCDAAVLFLLHISITGGEYIDVSLPQEIHLDHEQWENISEAYTRFYEYNHSKEDRYNRELIVSKIIPIINRIINLYLTPRQSQVMSLHRKGLTQINIAKTLDISQPTVSQHLNGKRRNGKKIGGAFLKIRRKIHEHTTKEIWSYKDKRILIVLDMLLDKNITHKRALSILDIIVKTH
jgi:predicted transcriptional regulator